MADQRLPVSFWQQLFQHSLLSLYSLPKAKLIAADYSQNYDFVFEFADSIIYLLVSDVIKFENRSQIDSSLIRTWRKGLVNQLIKRQAQLYESKHSTNSIVSDKAVYYVGLTALWIKSVDTGQTDRSYAIEHEYGSQFFAEDCVLDLDDELNILQIFSYQSFMKLLKLLHTPSDLVTFLQFHRHSLSELKNFTDESALFKQFLQEPYTHNKAIFVQKQLVAAKMMDEVESRLLKAVAPQQSEFASAFIAQTYEYTEIWHKLFDSLIKRRNEAAAPLPEEQIKILLDDSMYTYRRLVEEILAYQYADQEERLEGYVSHQHSFSRFGRHYILVFYAQSEASVLHANAIQAMHRELLVEFNSQLQNPVMEDLFLIGVRFIPHTDGQDTEVRIDVFYDKGLALNENAQRLNKQLAQLKVSS